MTGIKIPVSAELDSSGTDKAIDQLNQRMNRLAQTIASANKIKFNPVSQASHEELKKIEDRFKELTKVSSALRERLKATGQSGSSFGSVDWDRLYEDPGMRMKRMQQAFQHVTAGTKYGMIFPSGAPAGRGGVPAPAPPQPASQPNSQPQGPSAGGTLGGVAGAGLRAAGPVGGVVANAAGAGMSGGLAAGLFGLFGGLAALAIGKGIGGVRDKLGAAEQEGIGYDTLKRTIGDVNVSFSMLRETLRAASDNIDVTFEQSQKLGSDFAKLSGMTREQYKNLGDEVSVGGGFGRSFGMDPEASNAFFAQMRQFQVTSNANDSKRLALMIGEAVGKSGQYGKMDEVLQVIANFAGSQSRNGLASANVSGYAGSLAGMMASRVPGLDPQGAAALLNRVNGSISGGGAAGEAGQNYLFSALGRRFGLDPVQAALLQQQGAFGTGRKTFGAGSLYSQFSGKFGGRGVGGAGTSDTTNLSAILAKLQGDYGKNPGLMLNATSRLLGVNESQAMALHTIRPQSMGGMVGRMGRLGLDMNALSSTGILAMSNIQTGDRGALLGQADALRNSRKGLSPEETQRLNAAVAGGDTEKLRDILSELTYTREQEQTEGSKTRESIQGVDKRLQELATHLVGPMNDMRNAMVHMAGGGKLGATGIAEAVLRTESRERLDNLRARNTAGISESRQMVAGIGINDSSGELGRLKEAHNARMRGPGTADEKAAAMAQYNRQRAELIGKREAAQRRVVELMREMGEAEAAEKARLETDVKQMKASAVSSATPGSGSKKDFEARYGDAAKRAGKQLGVDPKLILSQWGVETGWGKSVVPGTNNLGNIKDFSGGGVAARDNMTGSLDRYRKFGSTDEFADHYVDLMKRKYKGVLGAGANGRKFAAGLGGYAEDPNYGSKIMAGSDGLFSEPMPSALASQMRKQQEEDRRVTVDGTFKLEHQNGSRAAAPVVVKKTVGKPTPAGA